MNDADLFAEKGAVAVRGAFELHWLERLAEGLERNLKDPSPYGCRYTKEGNPGAFVDDYCNWHRIPEYRGLHLRIRRGKAGGPPDGVA